MSAPLSFALQDRSQAWKEILSKEHDLVVIGGGITGAGIALDAASRGLSTVLLEKADFAFGTSSRSTKLIHGGLRYLKQFDFWLVKEVGTERSVVHKLAPHLVVPEKMLLPLIEQGSYGKWLTSIGLKVYDILAQVGGDDKRRMVEKEEALELEPLLPEGILKGAGYYAEYRTDDARLTLENVKTAGRFGAHSMNYAEVLDFTYAEGQINGVWVKDKISGKELEVRASVVVNAAGPWVDELRQKNNSKQGKQLFLTKGVHLVFPHEKLPVRQSIYFDVPDGRMIFAIPRGRVTYVGTTDTPFQKDKDHPYTDLADAMYLLTAVNNMFPSLELQLSDIESSWAGLRPLIHEEGKSASELSRKDEIFRSDTGLISIAGGKLTGYRKMAERVVDRVVDRVLGKDLECTTASIPLCGSAFHSYAQVQAYQETVRERLAPYPLPPELPNYLVHNYGKQCDLILDDLEQRGVDGDARLALLRSELAFCLTHEMVQTPMDFFVRRTGMMYFRIPEVKAYAEAILEVFEKECGIAPAQVKAWKLQLQEAVDEHGNFSADRRLD